MYAHDDLWVGNVYTAVFTSYWSSKGYIILSFWLGSENYNENASLFFQSVNGVKVEFPSS